MLSNLTDHRREKISDNANKLGEPGLLTVTSNNRVSVRSWLNGLGLPSSAYESATLQELENAYNSCVYNYSGLYDIIEIEAKATDELFNVGGLTKIVAKRAWANMKYRNVMTDPHTIREYKASGHKKKSEPSEPKKEQTAEKAVENTAPDGHAAAVKAMMDAMALLQGTTSTSQKSDLNLDKLADAIKSHGDTRKQIIELIKENIPATSLKIDFNGKEKKVDGLHHEKLPLIIKAIQTGAHVMMVGPAGSGKTTIAHQVAESMELPFYFNGALSNEYKLTGFIDAKSDLVRTPFREAYEHGGVYLFDEIDGSMPDALLAFNAALSNGEADFPDGTVKKHDDFYCLAAANTYGHGSDRVYVGRSQMDGASLDRFVVVDIDYDKDLEQALAQDDHWTDYVQKVRENVRKKKLRHIVSPRASIKGARLLKAGIDKETVKEMTVFKGMDENTRKKVEV